MLNSIFYKSIFKDFAFLVLRVFTGALLIHHGFEKLNDINNFADAFVRPLHLPFPVTLSYVAAVSEIGGSWLLIIGLENLSRPTYEQKYLFVFYWISLRLINQSLTRLSPQQPSFE